MKLLIAIPALNEEATLASVIQSIPAHFEGIAALQVLVVDDGSRDCTVEIARQNGADVISHPVNCGVGAALQTAISFALDHDFDILVNIDADNQFNPKDIAKLVAPLIAGQAEMVSASRFCDPAMIPPNMPPIKQWGNKGMSWLISKLCGQKFYDVSCGFRAYSKQALLNLNIHSRFTYTQETFVDMVSKKIRILEVPVEVKYFDDRESRVAGNIWRYGLKTLTIIIKIYRDYFPMRFFGSIAAVFLLMAFIFGGLFFGHFLITGKFTGFLFAGFLSGFFMTMAVLFLILALALDMLDRIRMNQERILYRLKRQSSKS